MTELIATDDILLVIALVVIGLLMLLWPNDGPEDEELKMTKEKRTWFHGPYPWLVATIAFLLPSINFFIDGDITGGTIFLVSAVMVFVNFLNRIRQKQK